MSNDNHIQTKSIQKKKKLISPLIVNLISKIIDTDLIKINKQRSLWGFLDKWRILVFPQG